MRRHSTFWGGGGGGECPGINYDRAIFCGSLHARELSYTTIKEMAPLLLVVVVSLVTVNSALAARIVGFSGASSGSHYFVVKKTMEELSSRGHEVCNHSQTYQSNLTLLSEAKIMQAVLSITKFFED